MIDQVLAIERFGPLRRGFRATHDQPARLDCGRCKAPAPYYFFIKTANSVCRGAGDSHLPQSLRARSPHVLSPRRRFQPLTDEKRSFESRRDNASPQGISPELSNLIHQVLPIERIGPLRRGISCYARPTYAVGLRQMQSTCTIIFYKDGKSSKKF